MNKKLLITTILLTIIYIISINKDTNFIMPQNKVIDNEIYYVDIDYKNKHVKLSLEDYVIGVVAAEMPASFEIEALKAQGIAARTYLINNVSMNKTIKTDTNFQVYIDKNEMKNKWKDKYDYYYNKIKEAVLSTKGKILTYNNQPIKAFYYSMSNGYTESSINVFNEYYDYLTIKESKWEQDNTQTKTINRSDFCNLLSINCNNINISNIKLDESNRVETITINDKKFSGIEVRQKLNLRSTDFTIDINEDNINITTKGYGHGVGMSQYGANSMAKEGYKYDEIVKYYYQNIEISNM